MNRVEFMAQLERLLYDLPEYERQDALCYYNDYFDDAGSENEAKVIQELGSPGKVAAIIRSGYRGGSADSRGEYTENGYRDTQFAEKGQMPAERGGQETHGQRRGFRNGRESGNFGGAQNSGTAYESAEKDSTNQNTGTAYEKNPYSEEQDTSHYSYGQDWRSDGHQRRGVGGWILVVLAVIFVAPIALGLGGGAIGLIGGLIGAVVAFLFSGFALAASGIVGIVRGSFLAVSTPGAGLIAIGGGLLLLAAGLILIVLFAWILFKFVPKAFRGIVNFLSRVFHHGRGRDEGGEQS